MIQVFLPSIIENFRKDLMIRGLPDRIHDCHQMNMLYPSIPKVNLMLVLMIMVIIRLWSDYCQIMITTSIHLYIQHSSTLIIAMRAWSKLESYKLFDAPIKILISEKFQDQAFGKYYSSPPETVLRTMIAWRWWYLRWYPIKDSPSMRWFNNNYFMHWFWIGGQPFKIGIGIIL